MPKPGPPPPRPPAKFGRPGVCGRPFTSGSGRMYECGRAPWHDPPCAITEPAKPPEPPAAAAADSSPPAAAGAGSSTSGSAVRLTRQQAIRATAVSSAARALAGRDLPEAVLAEMVVRLADRWSGWIRDAGRDHGSR